LITLARDQNVSVYNTARIWQGDKTKGSSIKDVPSKGGGGVNQCGLPRIRGWGGGRPQTGRSQTKKRLRFNVRIRVRHPILQGGVFQTDVVGQGGRVSKKSVSTRTSLMHDPKVIHHTPLGWHIIYTVRL